MLYTLNVMVEGLWRNKRCVFLSPFVVWR